MKTNHDTIPTIPPESDYMSVTNTSCPSNILMVDSIHRCFRVGYFTQIVPIVFEFLIDFLHTNLLLNHACFIQRINIQVEKHQNRDLRLV